MQVVEYNPPWTARERVSEGEMERYLEKKSDSIKVEVIELEHFLLGPENAEFGTTFFFAENARDGGYSKFDLLDTPRGKGTGRGVEVADAARYAEAASEVRRLEEASAARTMARPRAGNTKGRNINECLLRTVTPGVLMSFMLGRQGTDT